MSRCGTRSGYVGGCVAFNALREPAQRVTTYGSLFSGVGGFDLGCDAAGWECAWQVEWDAKARSVLARHWPNVPRYEDVRDVHGHDLVPVDVITYGFPCQDLSVAGKRAGLDGDRSGLFFQATRIIREMREATGGTYPRVAIAENVVGLLNADGGAAMGRCLDELAAVGALAVEWRVLDAQFFGVPQRRRRVFLVAVFDPRAVSRGQVFPEPESVSGDSPKGRTPGPTLAGSLTGGLGSGGPDAAHALNGWMIPHTHTPEVVGTLSPGAHPGGANGQDAYTGHLIPIDVTGGVFVKAKRAQSVDDDESWKEDGVAPTLNAFDNAGESRATVIAFGHKQGLDAQPSTVHTPTLRREGGGAAVSAPTLGVRRLTPRECERLMGWPDDHTRYTADGVEVADSARYRMCGNGVAAPVAKYVAECIETILQ